MSSDFSTATAVFQDRPLPNGARLVGYAALVQGLGLQVPVRRPQITFDSHTRKGELDDFLVVTARQAPEDTVLGHLNHAIRHEDLDLAPLKAVFRELGPKRVSEYVQSSRTGIATRQAWFLYEWLLDEQLPIPDLTMGNYVPLLAPDRYHASTGALSRRHRVSNNLTGTPAFCPIIRRTGENAAERSQAIHTSVRAIIAKVPAPLFRRAASSMLFGETKTTYAIENERPPRDKLERWGRAIAEAGTRPVSEAEIERLQRIVLPEGSNLHMGWRRDQNFVGGFDRHYEAVPERVNPRPHDLRALMDGWLDWMGNSRDLDPVVAAAAGAFSFVYVHPLSDGNGRIHRYLLHHVLAERGFTPPGVVFPISLPMLEKSADYKGVLQAFDAHVMPFTQWVPNGLGGVSVLNDVSDLFRFPDLTRESEFVFDCVEDAALRLLPQEVSEIAKADRVMDRLSRVVDMPDDRMRKLVMFARQNEVRNRIPKKRLKRDYADLTEEQADAVETILDEVYGDDAPPSPSP